MDPNATVDRLALLVLDGDSLHSSPEDRAEEAAELLSALAGWLSSGGFPPDPLRVHKLVLVTARLVDDFWT
jgi:hypothetical protein